VRVRVSHEAERIEHAGVRANSGLAAGRARASRPRAGEAAWRALAGLPPGRGAPPLATRPEQLGRSRSRWRAGGSGWDLIRDARGAQVEKRAKEDGADWSPEAEEVARARRFVLERRLAPLPEVRLGVTAAPPYRRPLFARAAYLPAAPFDVEPQGMLLVPASATARRPEPRERAVPGDDLALVAAREGWPGRHLQSAHAIHCGSRLRRIAGNRLLAGGWALYAEELMVEEGFTADAGARLGWLIDLLDSATRAVAGVALHTGRMNPAQAADYLIQEALLDRPAALAEVKRLTLDPARGLGGLVGGSSSELREEAKRRLGASTTGSTPRGAARGGTIPPALLREELWRGWGELMRASCCSCSARCCCRSRARRRRAVEPGADHTSGRRTSGSRPRTSPSPRTTAPPSSAGVPGQGRPGDRGRVPWLGHHGRSAAVKNPRSRLPGAHLRLPGFVKQQCRARQPAHIIFSSGWTTWSARALRPRAAAAARLRVGQDVGSAVALPGPRATRRAATRWRWRVCSGLRRSCCSRTALPSSRMSRSATRNPVRGPDEPTSAAARLRCRSSPCWRADEQTPPATTKAIAARNRVRADVWLIPTRAHGRRQTPGYFDRLARWFKQWTPCRRVGPAQVARGRPIGRERA
jgi:hypothetical protein